MVERCYDRIRMGDRIIRHPCYLQDETPMSDDLRERVKKTLGYVPSRQDYAAMIYINPDLIDHVTALIRAERAAALEEKARVLAAGMLWSHAEYPERVVAWLRARAEEERRG